MREAASAVQAAAEHKRIDLSVETSPVPTVPGDPGQLLSALTNLMSNAVKYTPEGGGVTARLVSHGDEIAIAIEDTGVGIPKKDLNRIFERFYRVDRGRNASTGGTGLGLSIVRNVAVNHGGRVEVVSEEGVGSTFSIVLPIETNEAGRHVDNDHVDSTVGDSGETSE